MLGNSNFGQNEQSMFKSAFWSNSFGFQHRQQVFQHHQRHLNTRKSLKRAAFSTDQLHKTRFHVLRIHVSSWSLRCAFFHLLCTVSGSFVPSRFGRLAQNSLKSVPICSLKKATTVAMSATSVFDDRDALVFWNEKQLCSKFCSTYRMPTSFVTTFDRFDIVGSVGAVMRTTSLKKNIYIYIYITYLGTQTRPKIRLSGRAGPCPGWTYHVEIRGATATMRTTSLFKFSTDLSQAALLPMCQQNERMRILFQTTSTGFMRTRRHAYVAPTTISW